VSSPAMLAKASRIALCVSSSSFEGRTNLVASLINESAAIRHLPFGHLPNRPDRSAPQVPLRFACSSASCALRPHCAVQVRPRRPVADRGHGRSLARAARAASRLAPANEGNGGETMPVASSRR
jgi:hypothetical protein